MGKDKKQTTTQELDPQTQQFVEQFLRPLGRQGAQTALGAGQLTAGPTDTFRQGLGGLLGLQDATGGFLQGLQDIDAPQIGGLGFTPGQFDPSSAQQFFNPFQEAVIEAHRPEFERQRQSALTQAAQEATARGAFGGSRSGLLQAQTLRDVQDRQARQIAALRQQGFESAAQRAQQAFQHQQGLRLGAAQADLQGRIAQGQLGLQAQLGRGNLGLSGLGFQAGLAGQIAGLGELERQIQSQQNLDPIRRQQLALQSAQGGLGPFGTRTSQVQPGDLFGDVLGAGLIGASLFNPFGGGGGGGGGGAAPGQGFGK